MRVNASSSSFDFDSGLLLTKIRRSFLSKPHSIRYGVRVFAFDNLDLWIWRCYALPFSFRSICFLRTPQFLLVIQRVLLCIIHTFASLIGKLVVLYSIFSSCAVYYVPRHKLNAGSACYQRSKLCSLAGDRCVGACLLLAGKFAAFGIMFFFIPAIVWYGRFMTSWQWTNLLDFIKIFGLLLCSNTCWAISTFSHLPWFFIMGYTLATWSLELLTFVQYKNARPAYLKNVWNVINWKYASKVYKKVCPWPWGLKPFSW